MKLKPPVTMNISRFTLLWIAFTGLITVSSCGFAEEMTDRAADSPEGREKSYVIDLYGTDVNVASKTWESFMSKQNSRVMRIKGSPVRKAESVSIAGLPGSIDIKSQFQQSGSDTEMRLWFVKDAEYLTPQSDPQSYDVIDRFIDQYFVELEAEQIRLEVENEQDKLKDLEKDLAKLRRDNEKLHSDITRAEQTIKDSRIKIEENLKAQDQMSIKIQEQKEILRQTQDKLSGGKSL